MDTNVDKFMTGIGQIMGVKDPSELALYLRKKYLIPEMNDVQKTIASVEN